MVEVVEVEVLRTPRIEDWIALDHFTAIALSSVLGVSQPAISEQVAWYHFAVLLVINTMLQLIKQE